MKRYHSNAAIKHVAPILPPMSPEQKKAAVARFEAKNKSSFIGGKVDIISDLEYKQDLLKGPKNVTVDHRDWEMVNRRLDDLIVKSDAILKQMKEQFGE